jgi:hypothetical protein
MVYELKALTFRAYLAQIEKIGALAEVKARVQPETLHAMESPPLPTAWIDPLLYEDMMGALEAVRGIAAVRTVTKSALESTTLPNLRPIVGGLLRLFGTSPATLLSRVPDFSRPVSRGVDYEWQLDTPHSGRLTMIFPRRVPRATYVAFESGLWLILELCGVRGHVAPTEISDDGTRGTIHVTWLTA